MSISQTFDNIPARTNYHENGQEHSSIHIDRINTIGQALTTPGTWWLNGFARVCLLDFKAGHWGQKKHAVSEALYRMCLVIIGIVTLPFVLLTALLGMPLRALTSNWKKDFIVHSQNDPHGSASPNPVGGLPTKTENLTIHIFNALLMPELIVIRNKHRPAMERAPEIAEKLIEQDADFICLHECFSEGPSEVLGRKLHAAGYNVVRNVSHNTLGLNSGLFLASKYPLSNIAFHKYQVSAGIDGYANKGVLIGTAEVNGKKVVIANTHLNAAGTHEVPSYAARALQILAMSAHVDKYVKQLLAEGHKVSGVLTCGDLNISPIYYGKDRQNGRLVAAIDPEWLLNERVHAMMKNNPAALKLPNPSEIHKEGAWKESIVVIKQIYQDIEAEINTDLAKRSLTWQSPEYIKEFAAKGSPFSPKSHTHILPASDSEIPLGTTVDMNHESHPGWGIGLEAQPESPDHFAILNRRPDLAIGQPIFNDIEITPMTNKKGQLMSDHLGLLVNVSLNDSALE